MKGFCEYGTVRWGSIRGREFLRYVSDYQLFLYSIETVLWHLIRSVTVATRFALSRTRTLNSELVRYPLNTSTPMQYWEHSTHKHTRGNSAVLCWQTSPYITVTPRNRFYRVHKNNNTIIVHETWHIESSNAMDTAVLSVVRTEQVSVQMFLLLLEISAFSCPQH